MMGAKIKSLGVEVPGRVTRNYDDKTGLTTLVLDEDQVLAIHEQLEPVMSFFNSQHDKPQEKPSVVSDAAAAAGGKSK